jgi:hypothetical protein
MAGIVAEDRVLFQQIALARGRFFNIVAATREE